VDLAQSLAARLVERRGADLFISLHWNSTATGKNEAAWYINCCDLIVGTELVCAVRIRISRREQVKYGQYQHGHCETLLELQG